ncbi:MAG: alkaline phosphatase, partial [Sphingomonadales bacterium]
AYAHAAMRHDVDLAVHLGDYLYEYAKGAYAPERGAIDGRVPLPEGEVIALADYRLRYASYRSDPDLQSLHAMKPMIVSMDDHELANNSWEGGAQNHQANEGDYSARRGAAMQAWREWMPVSETPWGSYDIGGLATLFRTDTRLTARSQGADTGAILRSGGDPIKALAAFRDGPWHDQGATMLGSEQEAWLARAMARSVRSGAKWQIVGFGTIIGRYRVPEQAGAWLKPDAAQRVKDYTAGGVAASKLGLPADLDNWGGYPAARSRFLGSAQDMGANLIVLCGDSHNAWAFDLGENGKPAGVEFAGTSVTSPGNEAYTAADPRVIERALIETNPELKWCEMRRRGYMAVTLTPEQVRNDYVFMDTIAERSMKASVGHTAVVQRGRNRLSV